MTWPIFDKQEDVPEQFHDRYEERDGKWQVKEDGETKKAVEKLQGALDDERTKREAAEALSRKTAAELQKLQNDDKGKAAGLTKEKLDEMRAEVRKEVLAELDPQIKAGETAANEVRTLRLDNRVKALAAANGVRADRLEAWWKQHKDRFNLTDDGKEIIIQGHAGKDPAKFIADELKKEIPEFYQGTKGDGGGGGGIHDGGAGASGLKFDDIVKNPGAGIEAANAVGAS